MSRLDRIIALVGEADEELSTLHRRADEQRVEIHQLRQRVQRAQERNRELEDRVAELELAVEQAEARAKNAVAATLAHAARTT